MEPSVYEQTGVFLWAFLLGAVICALYTAASVLRALSPPGRRLLVLWDFLFAFIAGMLNLLFALALTQGRIRGYVVFAEALTFSVLYLTAGRLIVRSADAIHRAVKSVLRLISAPFLRLYKGLAGRISGCISFLAKKCKNFCKSAKIGLKNGTGI